MAEESIKTSKNHRRVSTDSSYYGGNSRRNSGGKPTFLENGPKNPLHRLRASTGSFPGIVNSNKNAKGKPSSVNGGESVGPHYLRASTGSCHDFCKYGRKDAVEVKPWRSIPKRVKTPSSDMQNPVKSEVPAEKKTKKVLKSPSILKQEVSSHSKKAGPSLRKVSPKEKKIPEDEKNEKYSGKHTSLKPKAKTNLPASSHILGGLQGRKNNEIKMGKKAVVTPAALISPKPSMNRVGSLKVKRLSSLKLLSSLKNQKLIREAKSKQPNDEKVPEKTLHVVEVGTEKKIPESIQEGVTAHSPTSPLLSPPRVSSFPKSLASSFHEEEEEEEEFECAVGSDDSISENSDTEKNCKKAPRKSGVYLSENKNCTPKKVKFRRGKVVELQTENNSPRGSGSEGEE
ncbi:NADH dehydrogenase [Bertholletia excelsa]